MSADGTFPSHSPFLANFLFNNVRVLRSIKCRRIV
jgi:hypothetical protein